MTSEWEELTLGELGRVVTGKTPLTAVDGNFGGQIPFVTPSDMDARKTISTTSRNLTEAGAKSVKGSKIPAGSVMVSCIGSDMGKAVIAGRDCVTNQQINSIVVDDRFCSEFIYYNLSTRKDEIRHQAAGGSAQPILNKGDFSRLEITLPPLPEQRAIASILVALDDKIELNRRMNATLEGMARALFQSWFVDFDPVRAKLDVMSPSPQPSPIGRGRSEAGGEGLIGMDAETAALFPAEFEESTLGPIPTGWEVKPLGEVIELAYGKPLKAEDRKNGPVCVYGANGPVGWHDEKLVSGPGIIVGRKGNPGVVTWAHGDFYPIDTTFYVEPIGACRSLYFFYYALSLHSLANLSADSAVPGLNRNHAYMSKQLIPSKPALTAFDSQIAPIFATIHANEVQSCTLAALRDTLLPKLLSGELRVEEAEEALGAER